MATRTEATTRFNVDITQLKKSMQDARREIKLAKSEFDAVASSCEDWTKETNGLEAKLSQLDKTLSSQKSILSDLKTQYNAVVEEQGANSKAAQNLLIDINRQQTAINRTEKDIRKYSSALDELRSEADSASDSMDDLGDSAEDAGRSANSSEGGFTTLKGALADLVADGIRMAIDAFKDLVSASDEAMNRFQAQTGATAEEMAGFEEQMNELYKNNYGESLADIGDKMAYVKQVTGETDPSKIKELVENAIVLEDTFGSDFNETIRGVNNLMLHFGIDSETAFDLFAKGSQNGLDYTSELGDNIAEYGGNFAQAGYSAEEYFQLLTNGAQGGAYNLDKVNDSINEVKNRLADGTIADNIGVFSGKTQELFTAWQNGEVDMKEVINSIVGDISNCTNEQEALNMAQVAFGTMGEDANLNVVKSLTALGDSYSNVSGTMEDMKEVRYDDVVNQLSGLGRTVKTDVLAPMAEELLPTIKDIVEWLPKLLEHKDEIIAGLAGIGVAFLAFNVVTMIQGVVASIKAFQLANEGATLAQWALNAAMNANPIGIVVALIAGLVTAFVVLWNKSDKFRQFFINLWTNIKLTVSNVVGGIVNFFTVTVPQAFQSFIDWVKSNWQGLLLLILNPFAGAFKLIYDNSEGFRNFMNGLWESIKNIFGSVTAWFSGIFSGAWTAIKNVFSGWGAFFGGLWDKIKEKFSSLGSNISDAIGGSVKSGINSVIGMIERTLNKAVRLINGAIDLINKAPGVNVGKVKELSLPRLARGGILKRGQVGLLEGDGAEAVVPLERNTGWIRNIARQMLTELNVGGNIGFGGVGNGGGVTYNFYQTNNSPKALNRLDIYRQSKNLLGYVGGGANVYP